MSTNWCIYGVFTTIRNAGPIATSGWQLQSSRSRCRSDQYLRLPSIFQSIWTRTFRVLIVRAFERIAKIHFFRGTRVRAYSLCLMRAVLLGFRSINKFSRESTPPTGVMLPRHPLKMAGWNVRNVHLNGTESLMDISRSKHWIYVENTTFSCKFAPRSKQTTTTTTESVDGEKIPLFAWICLQLHTHCIGNAIKYSLNPFWLTVAAHGTFR